MTTPMHRAVIVTAADFNGRTFDGQPFVPLLPLDEGGTMASTAPWLVKAIEEKRVLIEARGGTDYAWFGVKDEYDNVHWAGPGDMIVKEPLSGLLRVVPAMFVKYLERLVRDNADSSFEAQQIKVRADVAQLIGLLTPQISGPER